VWCWTACSCFYCEFKPSRTVLWLSEIVCFSLLEICVKYKLHLFSNFIILLRKSGMYQKIKLQFIILGWLGIIGTYINKVIIAMCRLTEEKGGIFVAVYLTSDDVLFQFFLPSLFLDKQRILQESAHLC